MGTKKKKNASLNDAAFKFGLNWGGLYLGVPSVLATLALGNLTGFATSFQTLLRIEGGGILWIILPCCACLSTAMSVCPPPQADTVFGEAPEVRHVPRVAWAMFGQYLGNLLVALSPLLGKVWLSQQTGYALPFGRGEIIITVLLVGVLLLGPVRPDGLGPAGRNRGQ